MTKGFKFGNAFVSGSLPRPSTLGRSLLYTAFAVGLCFQLFEFGVLYIAVKGNEAK